MAEMHRQAVQESPQNAGCILGNDNEGRAHRDDEQCPMSACLDLSQFHRTLLPIAGIAEPPEPIATHAPS